MSGLVRVNTASPGDWRAEDPGQTAAAGPGELETLVETEADLDDQERTGEDDPSGIVEQAELLLRESAPHDFDVLVVGGGTAGCAAALRAAQLGARVGLVDGHDGGQDSTGDVRLPSGDCFLAASQSLLEAAHLLRAMRRAPRPGVTCANELTIDFEALFAHKDALARRRREAIAADLTRHKIEIVAGQARFVAEHTVEIEHPLAGPRRLTAVQLVIAAGSTARPDPLFEERGRRILPIDAATSLPELPRSLAIVGGDAAAVEMAYLYHQLGSRVTLLAPTPSLLPEQDSEVGDLLLRHLGERGIEFFTGASLQGVGTREATLQIAYERGGSRQATSAETVLIDSGRVVDSRQLGLDRAGIEHQDGCIVVDDRCETSVSGVFAVGDCIRGRRWPQRALAEGRMVAELILGRPPTVDLRHVPRSCRTRPETAVVGHTLFSAKTAGIAARVGLAGFADNDKAVACGETDGFVKVVVDSQSERLIGCQIVGPGAGEVINQAVLALNAGQNLDGLAAMVYGHPTFGQALGAAARNARNSA